MSLTSESLRCVHFYLVGTCDVDLVEVDMSLNRSQCQGG